MAVFYNLENNANSTVVGGLAAGALALTVADGSVFPATYFLVTIWDRGSFADPGDDAGMEIVLCTSRAGNVLTIVRAQEGTADVTHAALETVWLLVTKAMLDQMTTVINANEADIATNVPKADWNANGFATRATSTLLWTDAGPARTLSIQPAGASFDYWVAGVRYTTAGDTVQIADVEGIHAIYYNGATLTALANPTAAQVANLIHMHALVSFVYWDTSAATAIYVGEERHGKGMSADTHLLLHVRDGMAYLSGLGLNTISADGAGATADAQFGVDAGEVADEDIYFDIASVGSTTGLPIYYMLGGAADWQKHTEAGFSVRTLDGTNADRLAWNQYTGGAWQLTEAANNDFVLCHVFATTEKDKPMIAIMGQATYATTKLAREGALTEIHSLALDDILFPEIRPIATVIFQTNLGYASAVNARVVTTDEGDDYVDWRDQAVSRTAVSTSAHGDLSGLGNDDHTQYPLLAGRTGGQALSGSDTAGQDLTLEDNTVDGNTITVTEAIEAHDHVSANGSSHGYLDQSVVIGSSPTLDGANFSGVDHGGLDGLGDDDHTQYFLVDGSRDMTGQVGLSGSARVKKCIYIAAAELCITAGGSPPAISLEGYFPTLDYDDTSVEEAFATFEVPVDWDSSTDMTVSYFWLHDTNAADAAKYVRWRLSYNPRALGEAVAGATTVIAVDAASLNANQGLLIESTLSPNILAANLAVGDQVAIRASRRSTNDDYVGDARLIAVRIDYTANSLGEAV